MQVYYITKGRVVIAKKAFSTLNSDYEITMDVKTEITEACVNNALGFKP